MYKISEFAKITGLSKETLRYYSEIKLLEPAYIDPKNHYRYYDDGSYFLAILLGKLRDFGLTIQEMQGVMNDESFFNLEALLLEKRRNLEKQVSELQGKMSEIDHFIKSGREQSN
jgi:DNA-binding transcriptional MerR regulator